MKNDNQNTNPGNNGRPELDEQRDAQEFTDALDADPRIASSLDDNALDVFRIGTAIRQSAADEFPERSDALRESLIDALDKEDLVVADRSAKKGKPAKTSLARYALAASLLLAIGLITLIVQFAGQNAEEQVAKSSSAFFLQDDVLLDQTEPFESTELYQLEPLDSDERKDRSAGTTAAEIIPNLLRRVDPSGTGEIKIRPLGESKIVIDLPGESSDASGEPLQLRVTPDVSESKNKNVQIWNGQVMSLPPVHDGDLGVEGASGGFGGGGGGGASGSFGVGGSGGFGGGGGSGWQTNDKPYATDLDSKLNVNSSPARGVSEYFEDERDVAGFEFERRRSGETAGGGGRPTEFFSGGEIPVDISGRFRMGFHGNANREQYDLIHENKFIATKGDQALSTFSIDVDTASYANMRRFLNNNHQPPRNSIRIEELVNYFSYDYPQPKNDRPFSVNMELASCPWNERHHLLRVGLKGKEIHRDERSASNLVFLLDVSGSMQSPDKLPLLKQGLTMLVQRLSENDSVSIVTYAGNAGVVLNPTNGANKRQIEKAIETLAAGGSTNGSAGIELAYELAQKQFIKDGSNRIILATDGDLNVGVTNDNALVKLIKEKASEGVFLTVLGFGTGNLKDSKLEKLADNGNGMYAYIDNAREAHKVLVEQMSGSLQTIAKDVKIQIEFNPTEVLGFRLIGYENRVMAAQDFANDRKDAGEIGAGHTVTALYEIVLAGDSAQTTGSLEQPLKYQQQAETDSDKDDETSNQTEHSGEILTLALRYKKPDAQESEKIELTLSDEASSFSSASSDFQFAASVASFGMILRQSRYSGDTSLKWVEETASRCIGDDIGGYRSEFLDLVRKASLVR